MVAYFPRGDWKSMTESDVSSTSVQRLLGGSKDASERDLSCRHWGLPTLYASKLVMEMAQLCKAGKTMKPFFHSSHSRLEDADDARVSHIATTTATKFFNMKAAATASPKRRWVLLN